MTLTFLVKEDATLTLQTNNNLVKMFANRLEQAVNNFFNSDVQDSEFIITNYTRKFNYIIVNIKHRSENILSYFKKQQLKIELENLLWDFEEYKAVLKHNKNKNNLEVQHAKIEIKKILKRAKEIKQQSLETYLQFKKEKELYYAMY